MVEQIHTLSEQTIEQLSLHAAAHIFPSLPRGGRVRRHACRPRSAIAVPASPPPNRWPASPASPRPPRASGRTRGVGFRWACAKQLRDAVWICRQRRIIADVDGPSGAVRCAIKTLGR